MISYTGKFLNYDFCTLQLDQRYLHYRNTTTEPKSLFRPLQEKYLSQQKLTSKQKFKGEFFTTSTSPNIPIYLFFPSGLSKT